MFMQFLEFHYLSIQFAHIFSSNVYDVFHYYTLFINIDFSKKKIIIPREHKKLS